MPVYYLEIGKSCVDKTLYIYMIVQVVHL